MDDDREAARERWPWRIVTTPEIEAAAQRARRAGREQVEQEDRVRAILRSLRGQGDDRG